VPEPPRLCELRNDSNLEVVCQPGNDGGLQQHFVLEAVGATSMYFNNLDSTRSTHELDNEISTMNDQVSFAFFHLWWCAWRMVERRFGAGIESFDGL
jgi:hypothetical protein